MLTIFTLPEIDRAAAIAEGNYKAVIDAAESINPTLFSRLIHYVPKSKLAHVISRGGYLIVQYACIKDRGLLERLSQTVPASIIEAGVAWKNYAALSVASGTGDLLFFKKLIQYVPTDQRESVIAAGNYAVVAGAATNFCKKVIKYGPIDQLGRALSPPYYALVKAAASSHLNYELFRYIVSLVPGGMKTVTSSCGHRILSAAAEGGNTDIFAYVLNATSDIAAVLAKYNYSILVGAAVGGNSYIFKTIANRISKPILQIIQEHGYKEVIYAAQSGNIPLLAHIMSLLPAEAGLAAVSTPDFLAVIRSVDGGNRVLEYVLSILHEDRRISVLKACSHQAITRASHNGNFAVCQYIQSLIGKQQIVDAVTASVGNENFMLAWAAASSGNPFLLRHILNLIPGGLQEVVAVTDGDLSRSRSRAMYQLTAMNPLIAHVSLAHLPIQHQLAMMQAISNNQVLAIAQVLCSADHTPQDMVKAITKAQVILEFFRAIPLMLTHSNFHPLSPISRAIESYRPNIDTTYHYAMAMLNCYEQIALLQIHGMPPTFLSMLLLSSGHSTSQIKATTMALRFLHLTSHVQSYSHSTSSYLLARTIHEPNPLPPHLLPYNQVRIVCHVPILPFFSSKPGSLQWIPDATLVPYAQPRAAVLATASTVVLKMTTTAQSHGVTLNSRLPDADHDTQATGAAPLDSSSAAVPLLLNVPTSSGYTHAGSHDTTPTAFRPNPTASENADHLPQSLTAEGLYQGSVAGMFLVHNFHSAKYFVQNVLHLDTARALDVITPAQLLTVDMALATVAVGATYVAGAAVVPLVKAASIAVSTCAAHEITRTLHANVLLSQNISAPIHSVSDFAVQCGPQVALGAGSVYALSMLAAFTPFVLPPVAGIASAAALNGAMCFNAHNSATSSSDYHSDHYYIPEALAIGVATAMLLPVVTAGAPLAVVAITTVSAISAGAAVHSMAVVVLDYAFYGVDTAGNHADLDLAS